MTETNHIDCEHCKYEPISLLAYPCDSCSNEFDKFEPKDTKPDTDNLQKLLKDCMTAVGFWVDDAQVCSELTEKRWVRGIRKGGTASGIWISVREMEDNS